MFVQNLGCWLEEDHQESVLGCGWNYAKANEQFQKFGQHWFSGLGYDSIYNDRELGLDSNLQKHEGPMTCVELAGHGLASVYPGC